VIALALHFAGLLVGAEMLSSQGAGSHYQFSLDEGGLLVGASVAESSAADEPVAEVRESVRADEDSLAEAVTTAAREVSDGRGSSQVEENTVLRETNSDEHVPAVAGEVAEASTEPDRTAPALETPPEIIASEIPSGGIFGAHDPSGEAEADQEIVATPAPDPVVIESGSSPTAGVAETAEVAEEPMLPVSQTGENPGATVSETRSSVAASETLGPELVATEQSTTIAGETGEPASAGLEARTDVEVPPASDTPEPAAQVAPHVAPSAEGPTATASTADQADVAEDARTGASNLNPIAQSVVAVPATRPEAEAIANGENPMSMEAVDEPVPEIDDPTSPSTASTIADEAQNARSDSPEELRISAAPKAHSFDTDSSDLGADPQSRSRLALVLPKPDVPLQHPEGQPRDVVATVRGFDGGACFLAVPEKGQTEVWRIRAYGVEPFTISQFTSYMIEQGESDVPLSQRQVVREQCNALDFAREFPSASEGGLRLVFDRDRLADGAELAGQVTGIAWQWVYVTLVDDDGMAQDVSRYVSMSGDVAKVRMPVHVTGGGRARTQLVIVVSSDKPLSLLNIAEPQPLARILGLVGGQISASGANVEVAVADFQIE
jgi:hypothetical protein